MISRTLEQILTDYKRSFSKQNKSVFIQKIYYLKNIWSADIIKPNVDWRYSFYILYRTQNTSSMSILTPQRKCFFNTNYQLFNFSWIFSVDQSSGSIWYSKPTMKLIEFCRFWEKVWSNWICQNTLSGDVVIDVAVTIIKKECKICVQN